MSKIWVRRREVWTCYWTMRVSWTQGQCKDEIVVGTQTQTRHNPAKYARPQQELSHCWLKTQKRLLENKHNHLCVYRGWVSCCGLYSLSKLLNIHAFIERAGVLNFRPGKLCTMNSCVTYCINTEKERQERDEQAGIDTRNAGFWERSVVLGCCAVYLLMFDIAACNGAAQNARREHKKLHAVPDY